jgi:putative nucleotidyltransferase with HDIG domain
MNVTLPELINESSQLVSPPDVWVKINELVHDTNASAADMADVIQHDPGLTANILKVVNSAYYNLARQVDTVSRAIAIIGTNDLYNLATALTAARVFANIPCHLTSPDIFWRHSIATGILARKLASHSSVIGSERLYVAGLLHDVGSLLIYSRMPELSSEVLMVANGDEEVLYQAENDIIGFNHAMVSAELLRLWNLPANLVSAVGFHHEPMRAESDIVDAAIVCIANHVVNRHPGSAFVEVPGKDLLAPDLRAWEVTNLNEQIVEELMKDHEQDLAVALSVMLPSTSTAEYSGS